MSDTYYPLEPLGDDNPSEWMDLDPVAQMQLAIAARELSDRLLRDGVNAYRRKLHEQFITSVIRSLGSTSSLSGDDSLVASIPSGQRNAPSLHSFVSYRENNDYQEYSWTFILNQERYGLQIIVQDDTFQQAVSGMLGILEALPDRPAEDPFVPKNIRAKLKLPDALSYRAQDQIARMHSDHLRVPISPREQTCTVSADTMRWLLAQQDPSEMLHHALLCVDFDGMEKILSRYPIDHFAQTFPEYKHSTGWVVLLMEQCEHFSIDHQTMLAQIDRLLEHGFHLRAGDDEHQCALAHALLRCAKDATWMPVVKGLIDRGAELEPTLAGKKPINLKKPLLEAIETYYLQQKTKRTAHSNDPSIGL